MVGMIQCLQATRQLCFVLLGSGVSQGDVSYSNRYMQPYSTPSGEVRLHKHCGTTSQLITKELCLFITVTS